MTAAEPEPIAKLAEQLKAVRAEYDQVYREWADARPLRARMREVTARYDRLQTEYRRIHGRYPEETPL